MAAGSEVLAPGTRLGPFEIVGLLGAGGMGEVYRARDSRLRRDVAIKVLPPDFSTDPDRLRRFEQEARAAGALNHPNILAIYDLGTHDGSPFVVSELLEGETLRDRLRDGALPHRKAAELGMQIARGLAAAHERGIIHRDLKPENLFVTRDGRVKILDFGLAKLTRPEEGSRALTNLPTTPAATGPGVVMGTVGYMSPEQVRGRPSDHHSDLFSLGAILYEMVTGNRAFQGDSAVETLGAILKEDPRDLSEVNTGVPAGLSRIVQHCLEKNPEERFQSARDLAFNLEALSGSTGVRSGELAFPAVAPRRRSAVPVLTLAAGLLAGLLGGATAALWLVRPQTAEPPRLRFLSSSARDQDPAASPDGRLIAFSSTRDGRSRIWLKQLPGGDEVAITAGPNDFFPRFSPDGSMILFERSEEGRQSLFRIPVLGGEPRKILDDAGEGDWSPDGRRIAFLRMKTERGTARGILVVAEVDGRRERPVYEVDNQRLVAPRWSPDGGTIAVTQAGVQNVPNSIILVSAEGRGSRVLSPPPPFGQISSAVWSGTGDAMIYAQSESVVVTDQRWSSGRLIRQEIESGKTRTLMWVTHFPPTLDILGPGRVVLGAFASRQNLVEFPLKGGTARPEGRWLTKGSSNDRQPTYSPGDEWILFSSNRAGNLDLWEVSTKTGALRRVTDDPADDWDPAYMPDGKHIIWSSSRSGHFEIWISARDGSGARQVTQDGEDAENPTPTRDGRWIVYSSANPAHPGVWKIRPDGSEATRIVSGTVLIPDVSPDGRFAAYLAVTTGTLNTLRFVGVEDGAELPLSIRAVGGIAPGRARWLPESRAIAFVGADDQGITGVYVQDFLPGQDTYSTLRPLAGFDPENPTESFGISPDGTRITLAVGGPATTLMLAEDLPGVSPPRRADR